MGIQGYPASGDGATTPITVTDETTSIVGSRQLVNGTGTVVNLGTTGEISIDATASGSVSSVNGRTGVVVGLAEAGSNTDLTAIRQANVLSSGTEIFNGAGTFTATGNNGLVSCSGGSTATLNLPAYVVNRKLTLKVRSATGSSSGLLTVARQGSDQILVNGSFVTSTTISSYQTATFQSFDGSLIGFPGLTVWMRIEPEILPVAQGGTGATTAAGAPFALKGNNTDITGINASGTVKADTLLVCGPAYQWATGAAGQMVQAMSSDFVGHTITGVSGQVGDFINMNSFGAVGGNRLKLQANGLLTVPSLATLAPSTMAAGASGVMLSGRAATNGTDDALRLFYGPDGTTNLFKITAGGNATLNNDLNMPNGNLEVNVGSIHTGYGIAAGPFGVNNFLGYANGSIVQKLSADVVGQDLTLKSGQTADALNVTSNGGAAGDIFKVTAAGVVSASGVILGGGLPDGFTGSPSRNSFYVQSPIAIAANAVGNPGSSMVGLNAIGRGGNGGAAAATAQQGYSVSDCTTSIVINNDSYFYQNTVPNKSILHSLLPDITYVIIPSTITDVRIAVGLGDGNNENDLLRSSTPGSSNNGSTVAFMYDTAASNTTWRCLTSNTTTQTNTDSGVTVATDTPAILRLDMRTAGTVKFYINGVLKATHTTTMPTSTTPLGLFVGIRNLAVAAAKLYFGRIYGEYN